MNTLLEQEEFKDIPYFHCREKDIMMMTMTCNLLLLLPPPPLKKMGIFVSLFPSILWMIEVVSLPLELIFFDIACIAGVHFQMRAK